MSTMSTYSFASAVTGEINLASGTIAYDFPAGNVTADEKTDPVLAYLASVGIAKEATSTPELSRSKSAKSTSAPVEVIKESTEE